MDSGGARAPGLAAGVALLAVAVAASRVVDAPIRAFLIDPAAEAELPA